MNGRLPRALSALLAITMGANGVVMLAAGQWWYGAVPGVTMTGPFNAHFVKDIGAAYLVTGLAFAGLALRPTAFWRGAAAAGALFLTLHAGIHLAEAVNDPMGLAHLTRDFAGVILPALIAVWACFPYASQETRHAQEPA